MRSVKELTRQELEHIVATLQGHLYLEIDSDGRGAWDPDKSWDVEMLESVAGCLALYGLRPTESEKVASVSSSIQEYDSSSKSFRATGDDPLDNPAR